MLKVDMTIRGDPAFIQQEDFTVCSPQGRILDDTDPRLFRDGSLVVSNGQILVKLTFRFPDDINEETGLLDFNRDLAKENGSVFTGIYRVLKVENMFERGVFTQKLALIRIYNDKKATTVEQENPSALLRGVGDTPEEPETGDRPVQLSGPQEADTDADKQQAQEQKQEEAGAEAEEDLMGANNTQAPAQTEAAVQTQQGQDINAAVEQQKANEADQDRVAAEYRATVADANSQLSALSAQITTIDTAQNALKANLTALEASLAASDPEYNNLTEAQINAKYPEVKALDDKIQAKADERETVKQQVQTVYNSAWPPPNSKVNGTVSYDSNNVPNITLS